MSATWKEIAEANETIRTTTISHKDKKGNVISKEYAEVAQRVKAFRMVYTQGWIRTEMVSNENGICVFRASVGIGDTELATGTALEKESSSFINETSYVENCETSAVGRALGFTGFGIDTSIVSAEEVQNATKNQTPQESKETPQEVPQDTSKDVLKASAKQIEILQKVYKGENLQKLLAANKIEKIEDLPMRKASDLIKTIYEKRKEKKENGR